MREIKFRAWYKYGKKMIDLYKITPLALADHNGTMNGLFLPFDKNINLMQYTNLKDSKGVEIYEGDIVRFWIDNIEEVSEVFFECGCFSVKTKNTDPYYHPCLGVVEFVEIIGNLYENPELLPGKE